MRELPRITVRLLPLQLAWLDAVAAVRQTNRTEVIREAITWLAARESDRVSRTRQNRVIQLIARQEEWNPVDDFLAAAREVERDQYEVR
jgi:hypothetical protein